MYFCVWAMLHLGPAMAADKHGMVVRIDLSSATAQNGSVVAHLKAGANTYDVPLNDDGEGEWQDVLVDERPSPEDNVAARDLARARHRTLAQRDQLGRLRCVIIILLRARHVLLFRDGLLQPTDRLWHVSTQQNALGRRLFADDAQDLAAMLLQHDQITCGFGFEFVEHACIVRHGSSS